MARSSRRRLSDAEREQLRQTDRDRPAIATVAPTPADAACEPEAT
jgi:hypothetical protein